MLGKEPEARRHFSAVFTASKLTTGYFLNTLINKYTPKNYRSKPLRKLDNVNPKFRPPPYYRPYCTGEN